ncbi:TonB-dependent receptor [Phenylobacterium sp.]|uniref:TonB-dependent receptor n=1 Tax=Phenylobacterium sp. TaxID=1871053 RepID=UPI002DF1A468|nr:TonB-dependent receptor [Phenylobacterium sp.]
MQYRLTLFATSALLAAAFGPTAHAQTRPGSSAATTNTIEELVVTAEKREQNLQDIPVAISAFTDKTRDVVGIQTIQDMTNFTPGLQYSTSTDRITLRGLGRLTNVLSADASVANYSDGVYETFAVRAGASTLFLDRVEVLRGPQGTLYGRNAIAGAINEISKRPTKDWYAEGRVSYGNYNHSNAEFAVSGPLLDNVQFRLSGQWENQSDGWIKNTTPGRPSEGNVIDTFFLEGQVAVQFNDKFEMWSKIGYNNWQNGAGGPGAQSGGWSPNIYDQSGHVLPDISAGHPNGGNGFNIIEFPQASTNINEGFGCSGLVSNVVLLSPTGCVNSAHSSPWEKSDPISYRVRLPNAYTVASHWTYHAPGFDVKYITGGVSYYYLLTGSVPNGTRQAPVDSFTAGVTQFFPLESFNYQEHNSFWSHELNLVSTNEGPLQWITGAYYFKQHYTQPVYTQEDLRQVGWSQVPPFGVCLSGAGATVTPVGCVPGTDRRFDNRPSVSDESWATYGQLNYKVFDTLTLTGGLRYSHDRKYGQEQVRLLCFGLPACLGGTPPEFFVAPLDLTGVNTVVAGGTGLGLDQVPQGVTGPTSFDPATGFATRRYDGSWQAITGTAKAEWQPDTDTNLYASYSRGYRSGGFNIGIFTVLSFLPFSQKEAVDAYEVGFKKNWSRSLQTNMAAYYYSYNNLQIPISVIQSGSLGGLPIAQNTTSFYNVPKSRSEGFELETLWQPIDDLQLILDYSFNDTKIEQGSAVDTVDPTAVQVGANPIHTVAQCQAGGAAVAGDCVADANTLGLPGGGFQRAQNLSGNDLPNAPRNKIAVAANYTWHNIANGALTANVSYAWRDKAYGSLFKRWYNEAPSWDQWDARALWKDNRDKYEVIAYIKNIFNKTGYDQGATGELLNGAVSAIYGPSPAGLTCSPVVAGGVINCIQGIRKTFYPTPPRTYGIELRYKFF